MNKSSFVIFVDESGDEGFQFGKGSSNWFVLSGVIVRKENEFFTVKLVDAVREKLNALRRQTEHKERTVLHFRDLKHEQRLPFVDEIAKATLRTVSIVVHKPSIKEPEKFHERYRLYFYSVRLLLERVSWFCRDHHKKGAESDGTAEVVFSNRSGMSYQEMRDYLELLKRQSTVDPGIRLDWNVIRPDLITAFPPGKRMGLQIADAVASSVFYCLEPNKLGYTEDRYIKMLKPVAYHYGGRVMGYGYKFYPAEAEAYIKGDTRLQWVAGLQ